MAVRVNALIIALFVALSVHAETFVLVGESPFSGNVQNDRDSAINDAIKKGLLRSGAYVQGRTYVKNGHVESDVSSVRSSGKVSSFKMLREWHDDAVYSVKVSVDIDVEPECKSGVQGRYRKTALFTAFQREKPSISVVGRLFDVDTVFSKELSGRLYEEYGTSVPDTGGALVLARQHGVVAPELTASAVIQAAKEYQAQFVVAGSIVDMSMLFPDQYFKNPSRWVASIKDGAGRLFGSKSDDYRSRNFVFRMMLYDGVTGGLLFDKVYSGKGVWNAEYAESVGFGTPRFWSTDYGVHVSGLLNQAVNDLGRKLQCQPFMVRSRYLPGGDTLYLPVGVNQGVRVGDVMSLYFMNRLNVDSGGEDEQFLGSPPVVINDIDTTISVLQVYPTYSIATSSAKLQDNLQYIAVSW